MLKRARERQHGTLAARFFRGDTSALKWADPISDERPLSPTFRLWITAWPAVHQFADQFELRSQVQVRFGTMSEVEGVLVAGDILASHLEEWIKEDAELIRLRDPRGRWEVSLDVHDGALPRLAVVATGTQCPDLGALGEGTEPWQWDFLTPTLNGAVQAIKHLLLADEPVEQSHLRETLGGFGLELRELTPRSGGTCAVSFAVGAEPSAHRTFDSVRRALIAEVPDLIVRQKSV